MDEKKTVRNTTAASESDPGSMFIEMLGEGSVEKQERRGQEELLKSDVFPTDISGMTTEDLEEMGFEFHGEVPNDPIFQFVTLPEGWGREGTDHDMWSYIVDETGKRRIGVFYKAAFYDRRAFARLEINEEE